MFMVMNKKLMGIFKQLGMTAKHAKIYGALLRQRASTPLLLARETGVNRSSIYRYLSELQKNGLVDEVLEENTTRYRASPIENLELVVTKEESRVELLKRSVPVLINELKKYGEEQAERSEVRYYRGVDGLRQMLWKMIRSGKDYCGLGYQNWNSSVGKNFAERLRKMHIETGAMSREILNEIDDNYEYTREKEGYKKTYDHRAIDKRVLEIKHDTYVYGDIFAYYYHYDGEYFGVEIHNAEIARTEKQMFELLWKMCEVE